MTDDPEPRQFDDDFDQGEVDDGLDENGNFRFECQSFPTPDGWHCPMAGTEECDWECPFS